LASELLAVPAAAFKSVYGRQSSVYEARSCGATCAQKEVYDFLAPTGLQTLDTRLETD